MNLTRIIELVSAAHADVRAFNADPEAFDRMEYFDSVESALLEALNMLDPNEAPK